MIVDRDGLGGSSRSEVWELFDADETVADETVYLVAAALQGEEELAEQLGAGAPTPQRPDSRPASGPAPLHALLRSITVQGFRGIGPRATLELNPYRGITVISGRNGSGKSSFAEALEYALTGESYRFANRAKHWRDSWRNLHAGEPAASRSTSRWNRTTTGAVRLPLSVPIGRREPNLSTAGGGRRSEVRGGSGSMPWGGTKR